MKLTDEELIAAIESEEALALGSTSSELEGERTEALKRYRGEPFGNEVDGRSQMVDKSLMDTVQWIMPSLVRIFLGGDELGKFDPIGPEDEYAAECETEVCNWYLNTKSDLYSHIVSTLTDALLLKNGYMVANWTTRTDIRTETYQGLSDEEAAMLSQDQDVEIVEHTEYPDPAGPGVDPYGMPMPQAMLHDVKVERKRGDEFPEVESIPPDEMLVSRRHRWTCLLDADFVQWRRRVTIGQLRSEGFDIPDTAEDWDDYSMESVERDRFEEEAWRHDETNDPSRRVVMFKDTYIRIDLSGSGKPKLWRVAYVDGMKKPALKEEADIIPYAAFTPIIYPHSHVGTSIYDLMSDLVVIRTMMQRLLVDSTFLQTDGMLGIDINRANPDDALVRGPGKMIRVDGNPADALAPIVSPNAAPQTLQALEYMDGVGERRTGVTRYSAGLDGESLNKTATGVTALQSAADQRIELIARTLSNGFRDLFLIVHALSSKHSTKPVQLKLKGQWQAVDPRAWVKRTDFAISVGLGTGSPETQLMKLQQIGMVMKEATAMGLCGPDEFYNWFVEFLKAAGYKNPSKFVIEPQKDPQTGKAVPPPPQKDPLVQAEEIKAQATKETKQMELQGKGQELQQKAQADREKQQGEFALQASNDQRQVEIERYKIDKQAELELFKARLNAETELAKEQIKAQAARETAEFTAGLQREAGQLDAEVKLGTAKLQAEGTDQQKAEKAEGKQAITGMQATLKKLDQVLSEIRELQEAPREIVRGPDGRAAGVKVGNRTRMINRGPDGRATGLR